ncbi:MAG: L,D-transpeptidase [Bacteroidales bacterium]|nr:L,D-transpeptidase [Bacteroidales bacterium]
MRKIAITVLLTIVMSCVGYAQNKVIVSKKDFKLLVLNPDNDTICSFNCAIGLNTGDKQCSGDMRTPEGTFAISSIENSKHWTHDFNDGYGQRAGAYGPYFIRLKTPKWKGIGIHGTCFPESIGTRSSEGCVRLRDEDVVELIKYIEVGTMVHIESDK